MSSGLRAHLESLSARADRLQAAAVDLAEDIAALLDPEAFGDWVTVEDERYPVSRNQWTDLHHRLRFCGVETGPSELPDYLLDLTYYEIPKPYSERILLADRAFFAGYYAKCAFDTETPYKQSVKPAEFVPQHWIILYRKDRHLSRRVTSQLCLDRALEVEKDAVWEAFETRTELFIFCAGALSLVPRLQKWINLC